MKVESKVATDDTPLMQLSDLNRPENRQLKKNLMIFHGYVPTTLSVILSYIGLVAEIASIGFTVAWFFMDFSFGYLIALYAIPMLCKSFSDEIDSRYAMPLMKNGYRPNHTA